MTHWRTMFDESEYLYAFDLQGRDVTVTISAVKGEVLTAEGNKKSKKPVLCFEGKQKKLAINKTNAKTLASLYGNDTAKWIGRKVTLFPTTTRFGADTVECIRIRPSIPAEGKAAAQ